MSKPRTWQELLDFLTCKAKENGILESLKESTDQEDILKICLREEYFRSRLLEWITTSVNIVSIGKSSSKASAYRQDGNDKFRCKDNKGSLLMYSESIRYAPDNSEDLCLALANRSAALFHMDQFEDCLEDISLALQKGYPHHLRYKLYIRRGQCLIKLKKYRDAATALESAQQSLENMKDVPSSKKASLQMDIENILHEALSRLQIGSSECDLTQRSQIELPLPSYGENQKFSYASGALDLWTNEEKGRHVVANRNIQMGDILFVEKPFAFVVLPDQYNKHCHHCVKQFLAAVSCHECTEALYCSETCRKDSWKQYHQWECHGGLELLHSIGIAHLGLRVVLKADGLHKIKKCVDYMPAPGDAYGNKNDNYCAVYRLMPHLEDMQPEDRLQYGLTATLLTLYLRHHTDYFEQQGNLLSSGCGDGDEPLTGDSYIITQEVLFVGGLILRHIAQLVCNGHAITKLDTSPDQHHNDVVTESQVRIATAIYPSASMMNHSCDPNIINSFFDQHLIVRACKDISKGTEVLNCYGPHFRRMSYRERQEALKCQYFFTCKCSHCSRVVQYDFQDRFSAMLCSSCGGPLVENRRGKDSTSNSHEMLCSDCGRSQCFSSLVEKAFKAHILYNEGATSLEMGNVTEALDRFQTCLRLQKDCLYKYNKDLMTCTDKIAKCYAMLGEYDKSVDYLLESIAAVEEQFGSHSVELANELQKLTDVMICDLKQDAMASSKSDLNKKHKRAVEFVNKAKQILELNYGIWNSSMQEITEKEQWLRCLPVK